MGNRWGTTSCSAPEPLLMPSSSLGPGLEERWASPPSLSLQPTSRDHIPGRQSLRTGLLTWTAWGDRTYWTSWLHEGWELGRVWEPCPEGGNSKLWCFMSRYLCPALKSSVFTAENFLQPETHLMFHDPTSSLYHVSFLPFCLRVFFNALGVT